MYDANSGYSGYRMSNRAVEAYGNGEMPLSKWTKAEMISAIRNIDEEKAKALSKVKVSILRDTLLHNSSWHHTGKYFNETEFYSIDTDKLSELTLADIEELAKRDTGKKEPEEVSRIKGDFYYIEWTGTRNHPKANEKCLKDVFVEERGCFYHVFDEKGNFLLKKKIDSNGTRFSKYIPET